MNHSYRILILLTIVAALMQSCDTRKSVFSDNQEMTGATWVADDIVRFEMVVSDTTTALDYRLDIDITEDYPYSNMYLFVNMKFPNQRWLRDTVEFYVANRAGEWSGKKNGDTYQNEVLYKYKRKMPLTGEYEIEIAQAMRDEKLIGVERVGVNITYSE